MYDFLDAMITQQTSPEEVRTDSEEVLFKIYFVDRDIGSMCT